MLNVYSVSAAILSFSAGSKPSFGLFGSGDSQVGAGCEPVPALCLDLVSIRSSLRRFMELLPHVGGDGGGLGHLLCFLCVFFQI